MSPARQNWVVGTPARTAADSFAAALETERLLRTMALGTRRGTVGVPPERTALNPLIGLVAYAGTCLFSQFTAESFGARLHPWFDLWLKGKLRPGDHLISSYGYANRSFEFLRRHGGKTLIDGGNSHPKHYWDIITEEYARWNCPLLPLAKCWSDRARAMMPLTDYVLAPSSYVARSFLANNFAAEQVIPISYPVNLDCFSPAKEPRPKDRPLTIVCTGAASLRKGTPYLLDAFRIIRRTHPSARLLLTDAVHDSMRPLLSRWSDLPIEWTPSLPHAQLADHLRRADVFVLLSIEEGLVRTALEAMACGLPTVLTPHCGSNDFVEPGVTGEVVPIRDAPAAAEAVLKCFERLRERGPIPVAGLRERLSFDTFCRNFLDQLRQRGLIEAPCSHEVA